MTKEDEERVMLRAVREFSDCKKRVVALETELCSIAARFGNMSNLLSHDIHMTEKKRLDDEIARLPTPDHVAQLIDELREKRRLKIELQRALKEYGYDLN